MSFEDNRFESGVNDKDGILICGVSINQKILQLGRWKPLLSSVPKEQ